MNRKYLLHTAPSIRIHTGKVAPYSYNQQATMEIPTSILDRLQNRPARAPRSEREEILDRFLQALNPARVAEGFRPLTPARVATALQGIPTGDLHAFYRQCEQARSFGRYFWWALKAR